MRLLIIDNYDSFTFNLKHMCEPYVSLVDVIRNDIIKISDVVKYDRIILSPGPGLPKDAGSMIDIIKRCGKKIHNTTNSKYPPNSQTIKINELFGHIG